MKDNIREFIIELKKKIPEYAFKNATTRYKLHDMIDNTEKKFALEKEGEHGN